MSNTVDVSREFVFSSPVDITAALDRQDIQFLDVHDRRALVIFAGSILNLTTEDGSLTELERVEITVYDLPTDRTHSSNSETEAAIELIEDFTTQLSPTGTIM